MMLYMHLNIFKVYSEAAVSVKSSQDPLVDVGISLTHHVTISCAVPCVNLLSGTRVLDSVLPEAHSFSHFTFHFPLSSPTKSSHYQLFVTHKSP